MAARYRERLSRLESVLLLQRAHIDLQELRLSCGYGILHCHIHLGVFPGIPETLRPLCWRLLLDYLPVERLQWPSYLLRQRSNYNALVDDLIVRPGIAHHTTSPDDDHPLSDSPSSEWSRYFRDNEVLTQIDKDVRRLCPEMCFFQQNTQFPHPIAAQINLSRRIAQLGLRAEVLESNHEGITNVSGLCECEHIVLQLVATRASKVAECEYRNDIDEGNEAHWQVVERILFIYSKLNPGVKYVQGMNEVLGPIYYVFARDADLEWSRYAEPDTYYCFQQLMSEVKDNFIKTLDNSSCGIESMMTEFYERLQLLDRELYAYLVEELHIRPQYYAFRWLSLLLSQEFPLPDVIMIWDALFADGKKCELLQFVGLAMIEREKTALMQGDFSAALRLLQNYPEVDVGQLIVRAHEIRELFETASRSAKCDESGDFAKPRTAAKIATAISNTLRSIAGRDKSH